MRSEVWENPDEIKRALKENAAGPVLWYENGIQYGYDNEGHALILGVSGAGKSRRCTIPMVHSFIHNRESGVIVDPKAEIYKNTISSVPKDYSVHVINFRELFEDDIECWNPLTLPYELWKSGKEENVHRAERMLEELAHALYPCHPNTEPFWVREARSLFLGAAYILFTYAKSEQVNMVSLFHVISDGEERFGRGTYLSELVADSNDNIKMHLHSFVTTANETKGGIRSVFLDGLTTVVQSESIRRFLSHDDLHINLLSGEKPTLIYIILPDETPIYDDLAGVLVSQIMSHYIQLAERKYGGKLPIRLNVCLEELGNIGRAITNLPHLLSAGRSRNIRVQLVLQSISQLMDIYGESNATTIISNTDVRVAFRVNHWDTLTELSRMCGEKVMVQNGHTWTEPLITQSQLAAMGTGQALVMISGRVKFITWLPDYTEILGCKAGKNFKRRYHNARHRFIADVFDVQECVKDQKCEALRRMAKKNQKPRREEFGIMPTRENLEYLLQEIDKSIAEIELEEKKQNRRKKTDKKE